MAENKPSLNDIKDFSTKVESYAENNEILYLSALAIYCDEQNVSESEAPKWISESLRQKIAEECQESNIIEQNAKLPI